MGDVVGPDAAPSMLERMNSPLEIAKSASADSGSRTPSRTPVVVAGEASRSLRGFPRSLRRLQPLPRGTVDARECRAARRWGTWSARMRAPSMLERMNSPLEIAKSACADSGSPTPSRKQPSLQVKPRAVCEAFRVRWVGFSRSPTAPVDGFPPLSARCLRGERAGGRGPNETPPPRRCRRCGRGACRPSGVRCDRRYSPSLSFLRWRSAWESRLQPCSGSART
jgi:hypothetical protein